MSDEPAKNNRIRRVPESEKKGRVWPDKSQQASSYPGMLNPDLTKKDPIYSVITALPVIMLLIGLAFWYYQENGSPLIEEAVELVGEFSGVSTTQAAGGTQHFVRLLRNDQPKLIRITKEQLTEYQQYKVGVSITITAAPTVSGSSSLWVVGIEPQ